MIRPRVPFRFVVALAVLLAVAVLGFFVVSVAIDNQARGRRGEQIVGLLKEQRAEDRVERRDAAQSRVKAAKERARLLDLVEDSERRQRALLAYLKANGVTVPPTYVNSVPPTSRTTTRPRSGSTPAPSKPSPSPAPTPTPRPTPTPETPGLLGQIDNLIEGLL